MSTIRTLKQLILGMIALVIVTNLPIRALADTAAVLPASISRVYADLYHYLPTTQRYNADGDREDLAYPFTNRTLDGSVISFLGAGIIGDVAVAYSYDIDVLDAGYAYGVTDKLTLGIHIPYYWIKNNVNATFDSTNANVGLDPNNNNSCCIPISLGGERMEKDDVQKLIGDLYGFSPIETWQDEGIGDIELGGKYQFFLEQSSAFAITGGLRSPTGNADDPDVLTDVPWSYGNYALLLRLHYDYMISNLWNKNRTQLNQIVPTPGDVIVNTTFRYDYMLPDEQIKRVGVTPEDVFTNNREKVSRELGDLFNLEVSGKYQITDSFALNATYSYGFKQKDSISGNLGYDYESLETHTDSSQQIVILGASYSTMAAYRKKQSAVPMEISIAYRNRFAGDGPRTSQANPVLDTRWIVVGLQILM